MENTTQLSERDKAIFLLGLTLASRRCSDEFGPNNPGSLVIEDEISRADADDMLIKNLDFLKQVQQDLINGFPQLWKKNA